MNYQLIKLLIHIFSPNIGHITNKYILIYVETTETEAETVRTRLNANSSNNVAVVAAAESTTTTTIEDTTITVQEYHQVTVELPVVKNPRHLEATDQQCSQTALKTVAATATTTTVARQKELESSQPVAPRLLTHQHRGKPGNNNNSSNNAGYTPIRAATSTSNRHS